MIYVVEDNEEIRELQLYTLKGAGFDTKGFENGAGFYAALGDCLPELVILDVMLPDGSGINILKNLRSSPSTAGIPVIMVTAKTAEADRVKGLDTGADDYISKPFSLIEFLARVKAVLRRSGETAKENVLSYGDIELNSASRTVRVRGKTAELTLKEFETLKSFMRSPETVLTRNVLLDEVWGIEYAETRTVDMHINTLRKKLGPCGDMIKTVRGVGYKLSR